MMRILIVEDSVYQQRAIEHAFKAEMPDAELFFATNAEEVLEIIKEKEIDIIFVDYILEGESGLDILKEIQACGYDIPVVFMTAYGDTELVIEILKAGAYDYIIKDVYYFKLLPQVCRKVLEKHTLHREAKTLQRTLLEISDQLLETTRLIHQMNNSLSIESTMEHFLKGAIRLTDAEAAAVVIVEKGNPMKIKNEGLEIDEQKLRRYLQEIHTSPALEVVDDPKIQVLTGKEDTLCFPIILSPDTRAYLILRLKDRKEPSEGSITFQLFLDAARASLMNSLLFENVLKSKKLWQLTVDAIKDLILVVDQEGVVIRCNKVFADACGLSPEEVIGKNFHSLDIPDPYASCLNLLIKKDIDNTFTEEMTCNNRVFLLSVFPVNLDNKEAKIFTLKDVTEIRRLREQLYYSDKLASIGRLVSGVAHELNNPLTGIIGYTELLKMKIKDEEILDSLDKIHQSAEKCRSIVENLLTYSRQRPPENTLIFINDLIDSTIELRIYWLRQNNIRIIRDYSELPPIKGDPQQLQQVFLNILMNAEYAVKEAGRMEKIIEFKTSYDKEQNKIIVKISDNGTGITPEVLPKIFDPFFTTKPIDKGTGLGLSITYSILKQHEASISVESTPGEGTTFTVELPVT
jgi:PAS domain S-box-containing protein